MADLPQPNGLAGATAAMWRATARIPGFCGRKTSPPGYEHRHHPGFHRGGAMAGLDAAGCKVKAQF